MCADRAYDARALREQLRSQRCRVVIPSNPTRRVQATRYEKLPVNFFAMVCFAALLLWTR